MPGWSHCRSYCFVFKFYRSTKHADTMESDSATCTPYIIHAANYHDCSRYCSLQYFYFGSAINHTILHANRDTGCNMMLCTPFRVHILLHCKIIEWQSVNHNIICYRQKSYSCEIMNFLGMLSVSPSVTMNASRTVVCVTQIIKLCCSHSSWKPCPQMQHLTVWGIQAYITSNFTWPGGIINDGFINNDPPPVYPTWTM